MSLRSTAEQTLDIILNPVIEIAQHKLSNGVLMDYTDAVVAAAVSGNTWSTDKPNYYTKSQVDTYVNAKAPATGSTQYIQNQFAAAQSGAYFWIGEDGKIGKNLNVGQNLTVGGVLYAEMYDSEGVGPSHYLAVADPDSNNCYFQIGTSSLILSNNTNDGSTAELGIFEGQIQIANSLTETHTGTDSVMNSIDMMNDKVMIYHTVGSTVNRGIQLTDDEARIYSTNSGEENKIVVNQEGIEVSTLAGHGNSMVYADDSGRIKTAPLPPGSVITAEEVFTSDGVGYSPYTGTYSADLSEIITLAENEEVEFEYQMHAYVASDVTLNMYPTSSSLDKLDLTVFSRTSPTDEWMEEGTYNESDWSGTSLLDSIYYRLKGKLRATSADTVIVNLSTGSFSMSSNGVSEVSLTITRYLVGSPFAEDADIPTGWSLTGNSGLDSEVNFIGTTDDTDVVIKRNNVEIMTVSDDGVEIEFGAGDNSSRLGLYESSMYQDVTSVFGSTSTGIDGLRFYLTCNYTDEAGNFEDSINSNDGSDGYYNEFTIKHRQTTTGSTVNDSIIKLGNTEIKLSSFQDEANEKFISVSQNGVSVSSDTIQISTSKTPSSASDTGLAGQIAWDANYVYVCVATDTWKRSVLSSW